MSAATGDSGQPSISSSIEWSRQPRRFEFNEILIATDNFNVSLVIGQGGFGKVYKGAVINGSSVSAAAIKRLNSKYSGRASTFRAEAEMFSKLGHRHLVSFFGYCTYEEEMILVYEYISNGTLEDHLHKLGTLLSWVERLRICLGAARGLDYLHSRKETHSWVVHRDVKSSKIFLDESCVAKISSNGLYEAVSKTSVQGTFGYLDPNYYNTVRRTMESDVYAFGVLLFEVLCRKPAVFTSLDGEQQDLARWVREPIKKGLLMDIIDSGIRDHVSTKCLKAFARIAESCFHHKPKLRPTMTEVVVGLDCVLTLQQQKMYTSLQPMVDMLPTPSNQENLGFQCKLRDHVDEKLVL